MSAKFLVVEGLEGAGKSTAVNVIKKYLEEELGQNTVLCREPGGTVLGEKIRKMVKHAGDSEKIDARTELLLMYASRIQLVENIIKPALRNGSWVICDRFYYSTYAYQGGGREIDFKVIDEIHRVSLGDFKPDLTVYMDISPERGLQRAAGRGELDRFEREEIKFFKKTREQYLAQVKRCPEIFSVDASQNRQQVAEQILQILKERL